jgi:glucose/arabinose dehydrogenase
LKRILAAAATCLALLAACGGSEQQETDTTTTSEEAVTSTSAPASTSPTSAPAGTSAPATTAPPAASGPPRLVEVGTFSEPTYLISPPGDRRIFVVERGGRVVQLANGRAKEPAFLDIRGFVGAGGERGLFSIAFAPDYASSGLAYLSYTDKNGDSRIDEFRADPGNPDRLNPDSRRLVLGVDQPFANHNGGLIAFDPTGKLMIGFGDGGGSGDPGNRAQDLNELLGKLLRIDPKMQDDGKPYGIPEDNPFVGRSGVRPEIWAYGLRNPWRWSFDPATKDLYVGDVGQNRVEEVDYVPAGSQAGANYGWPRFEGMRDFKDVRIDESKLVRPVLDYSLSGGNCAVTGGGVYRGSVEQLRGTYLYADFCGGVIKGFRIQGGRVVDQRTFNDLRVRNLSSFGEDSAGEMYAISLSGKVYRISAS